MSKKSLDRYEKAPVEGEIYDPKGYKLLKHFRRWAKITTVLMALMLLATVVGAIKEEDPLPFFTVFFTFVITLGFVGIVYDRTLEQHKAKILNAKIRERQAATKSVNLAETSVRKTGKTTAPV
jgi:CHASE1-domain containing sensor protein